MKLAIISSVLPYHGGMGRVLDFEAEELYRKNINLTVFVPDYGKRIDAKYKIEYLKPYLKIGFGALCFDLIKKLEEGNFDVIYLHYPSFGMAELLLSKKIKQKIIIRYHMDVIGNDILRKIFFKFHNKFILPLILKKSDKIIFSTKEYGENSMAARYILQTGKNKSVEIPFGVDTDKFYFNENIEKQNQILFVAKLDKQHYFKGLENLIKTFIQIDSENNTKLKIIGNGNMIEYYRNIGNNKNIEFMTGCSDEQLVLEYQKSICTVLPSINSNEAFGLVLIESFSCGTPVIASNLPGVNSVVGDRGFLCESNNIESLKSQLEKMINIYFYDNIEYKKLQENSVKSIKEKYNWKGIVDELLTFFK